MVDPRIYGLSFIPVLLALVVLMFSVEPIPEPAAVPESFASDFDGRRAGAAARRLVQAAPARTPGSSGDADAADAVADRFGEIGTGTVAEQPYEGRFDGDDVELTNVLLTLPGNSSRTVVVVAARDAGRGSGATSSAAATGTLLELADNLGSRSHEKTIVLVSADGGAEGASGMREFLESYPTLDLVDAVIVVAGPGPSDPAEPHVLAWSTDASSSSAGLIETAKGVVTEEADLPAGQGSFLANVFRLAIPSGLGSEAVAVSEGVDAVAISGVGERSPDPSEDTVADISDETMGKLGNAVLALVLAIDGADSGLAHGPGVHLTLAGNLIPGWAIALLAVTLLLPALTASIDGMARAARRREPAAGSLLWASSRALPFLAALALAYLLALVGIAPDPEFPFDPGLYGFGWRSAGVMVALVAAFASVAILLRPFALPPVPARETLATALGVVASVSVLGIWLVNPYLGLLCVPLAHVWLLAARPVSPASTAGTIAGIVLALVPLGAAVIHLASRMDLGAEVPWILVLMVTGGQIGFLQAFFGCIVAGGVLGLLALAVPRAQARSTRGNALGARSSP